jgi:hypothetical protein
MRFTADATLIARARKIAADMPAKQWRERDALLDQLTDLDAAVDCANGPLQERNDIWRGTALKKQAALRSVVEQLEGASK